MVSLDDYKKKDKLIYRYFKDKYGRRSKSWVYLLEEIKHNDLMTEKYKNTCKYLNCVGYLLILISRVTGWISINAFGSLACIPVGIQSLQELKGISQSWRKKKKKHDKIVLLGKNRLNTIEVLITKALVNSYISHKELVSVNNVSREYIEIIEKLKTSV